HDRHRDELHLYRQPDAAGDSEADEKEAAGDDGFVAQPLRRFTPARAGGLAHGRTVGESVVACALPWSRAATNPEISRARSCPVKPASPRMASRLPCSRKRCGIPNSRTGTSMPASRNAWANADPTPPTRPLSSTVATSRCCRAKSIRAGSTGL